MITLAALAWRNRRKIAVCYVFLASDEASFVTGAVLAADGGGRAPIPVAARHQ
jgi:NAD(P)-dependent dehydrogenase (short-subunit alcohol dehydrogenase family)